MHTQFPTFFHDYKSFDYIKNNSTASIDCGWSQIQATDKKK